jgi:hypothetical protein
VRVVEGERVMGGLHYTFTAFSVFLLGLRFCDGDIPPYALHHTLVFFFQMSSCSTALMLTDVARLSGFCARDRCRYLSRDYGYQYVLS